MGGKRLVYTLEEVEKHLELFSGQQPIVFPTEDERHTDLGTTQRFYIQTVREDVKMP